MLLCTEDYQVVFADFWDFNTTASDRAQIYAGMDATLAPLRQLAPQPAAYLVSLRTAASRLSRLWDNIATFRTKLTCLNLTFRVRQHLVRYYARLTFVQRRFGAQTTHDFSQSKKNSERRSQCRERNKELIFARFSDPHHLLDCWRCGRSNTNNDTIVLTPHHIQLVGRALRRLVLHATRRVHESLLSSRERTQASSCYIIARFTCGRSFRDGFDATVRTSVGRRENTCHSQLGGRLLRLGYSRRRRIREDMCITRCSVFA